MKRRKDAGVLMLSEVVTRTGKKRQTLMDAIDSGTLAATLLPPGRPIMGNGMWTTTEDALKNYLQLLEPPAIIESRETTRKE